ncbi:MAG: PAS domain-containing protein [Candidatus Aminicenantes bacterium]|nr:PAS domain-containing protein [Candidatus Aminicenantes bacterium]
MPGLTSQILTDKPAQWYAELLNSIPVAIYRSTIEGKIVYCNNHMAQLFGFNSAGDFIGFQEINIYRDKKDRGDLVQAIMQRGYINDLPLPFKKNDGTTLLCSVSMRPLLDDDGMMVYIDALLRKIDDREIEDSKGPLHIQDLAGPINDFKFILDLQSRLIDISPAGLDFFGIKREEFIGKFFREYIVYRYHPLFINFFSDILKTSTKEEIFVLKDKNGFEHCFEFKAALEKKKGKPSHISFLAWDITKRIKYQKELLNRQRLKGVLEMAGGIAHNLNQPLMILNNLLEEISCGLKPEDHIFFKIKRMSDQINKLNLIAKKIGTIAKYEAMDYVGGETIVDIDKASLTNN